MKYLICSLIAVLAIPVCGQEKEAVVIPRETQNVNGWTVRVDKRLLDGGGPLRKSR